MNKKSIIILILAVIVSVQLILLICILVKNSKDNKKDNNWANMVNIDEKYFINQARDFIKSRIKENKKYSFIGKLSANFDAHKLSLYGIEYETRDSINEKPQREQVAVVFYEKNDDYDKNKDQYVRIVIVTIQLIDGVEKYSISFGSRLVK